MEQKRATDIVRHYQIDGKSLTQYEVYKLILNLFKDEELYASKDVADKIGIELKNVSSLMSFLHRSGQLSGKIIGGRMHYYKTERCFLQDLYHPLPDFVIKGVTKHKLDDKQPRRKKGEVIYKKFGD
jgi:hypothetical protein